MCDVMCVNSNDCDDKVLAIIVLFRPNISLVDRLLSSLDRQTKYICIVDNTPISVKSQISQIYAKLNLIVHYIELNENKGIAYAQNCGIQYALSNSFEYVLFLDQDSALPQNMIHDLVSTTKSLLMKGRSVAAVGPAFQDEKTGELASVIQQQKLYVNRISVDTQSKEPILSDYIISSGSLVRSKILTQFGGMMDELFIDWVDIEWGERCSHHGHGSYVVPYIVMKHSIGDGFVSVLGRKINLHSDFRNYFIVRNAVYLLRSNHIRKRLKLSFIIKVPQYIVFYSLVSKRKCYSLTLLMRAAFDGMVGNMGKGIFK
jgi:rhamnosyltransferase